MDTWLSKQQQSAISLQCVDLATRCHVPLPRSPCGPPGSPAVATCKPHRFPSLVLPSPCPTHRASHQHSPFQHPSAMQPVAGALLPSAGGSGALSTYHSSGHMSNPPALYASSSVPRDLQYSQPGSSLYGHGSAQFATSASRDLLPGGSSLGLTPAASAHHLSAAPSAGADVLGGPDGQEASGQMHGMDDDDDDDDKVGPGVERRADG